ncbi:MAG: BlaI/MecI/CopY family transcriptional regulator [Pyrinomonadaceae bacterium]
MARIKQNEQLTTLELEIMKILWENGSANVQTVQQQLERELAYTTVQTMLNVLHRKGKVERDLSDKAYVYHPTVSRSEVVRQTIGDLINRLFDGSAESLVMEMVETEHLTAEKLSRLNALIEKEAEDGNIS